MHGSFWYENFGAGEPTLPPSQRDWFNGKVRGWRFVDSFQKGDIITDGMHGAVVLEAGTSITVNTRIGGIVERSTWGFRDGQVPRVLRYYGK